VESAVTTAMQYVLIALIIMIGIYFPLNHDVKTLKNRANHSISNGY